jgi:uncharacterized repeat protein (TIGR01451 family)
MTAIQRGVRRAAFAVVLLTALVAGRAFGQASFTLSVSDEPDPVRVNQTLTYSINLTNVTGFLLPDVAVTNRFSGPVQLVGTTNSRAATVLVTSNTVTFVITSFPGGGQFTLLSLGVRPLAFGDLTNTITVTSFNPVTTNAVTNVITQVIEGRPDLAIAIRGPAHPVLVNDWVTYTLVAGNEGGNAAQNVTVSNHLPADVKLLSLSPSNGVTTVSNLLEWNVGGLGIGDVRELQVTVQPTNVGLAEINAAITAPNVLDTNLVNNTASTNLVVGPLLSGLLVASNVSAMAFNPQTGLMEQTVRVLNVGPLPAPAARLIVSELTNRLYNAVGTNDGHPFVIHAAPLETNQSVDLLLEYFVPHRLPVAVADSQLHAFPMLAMELNPPMGSPLLVTLVTNLANGDILIEFPSVPGQRYTVLYSADPGFADERAALPSIVAPADRVQWIDDGPPKTVSRPASVGARFYRVIQTP